MESKSTSTGGIGFTGALAIVFITLKLCGQITWSWWWVLSPIWISVSFAILVVIVVAVIAILASKSKH